MALPGLSPASRSQPARKFPSNSRGSPASSRRRRRSDDANPWRNSCMAGVHSVFPSLRRLPDRCRLLTCFPWASESPHCSRKNNALRWIPRTEHATRRPEAHGASAQELCTAIVKHPGNPRAAKKWSLACVA
eukprot:scaffold212029_cov43-Prasinocladus_malaysianus.AAC.2